MSEITNNPSVEGLQGLLITKAEKLTQELAKGNIGAALHIINELQQAKHEAFYNEIGHLTRKLHDEINSFSSGMDDDGSLDNTTLSGMSDASDRLNYVIEITEKTSHETMDRVDSSLLLIDKLDSQSVRFKDLLSLVGQLEGEFDALNGVYDRTCQVKQESEDTIDLLKKELTEILLAQSSQDISGQLIRRVITLLTQVQNGLVTLINMAAKVENLSVAELGQMPLVQSTDEKPKSESETAAQKKTAAPQAEGPQINTESNPEVVSGQDDVDELLSSLGF
ncbi:MAG: chemotaxis protein CheZ [Osedax symbiont Rs2]|nr:MAG: chemotaxis protein CheZ [Osedax symbiont Rs2]